MAATENVTAVSTKQLLRRIALSCLTAGLLFLSLPNPDQGWLAWIALVPLLVACRGLNPRSSFLTGLVCGIIANAFVFSWIFNVPGFRWYHFGLLALYLGLYPALWCAGLALIRGSKTPVLLVGPALWVSLDFIKAHAGFLAFPWASLAYTQHNYPALLQMMTVTGEYGVIFLLVVANLAVYKLIFDHTWRRALAVLVIILSIWTWGAYALTQTPPPGKAIKITVVQPSILLTERKTAAGREASLARMERLTREAANQKPTFMVWPETALKGFPNDPIQTERIKRVVMSTQIPLILGTSEYEKFSLPPDPHTNAINLAMRSFNSAYLVMPNGTLSTPYRKQLLVPFAEYLPGEPYWQWPPWIVRKSYNIMPGNHPGYVFPGKDLKIALIICWENLFPDFVRHLVKNGVDVIVQLTNDNHFGHSAAPRQHNIASRLRAVENRITVVVASNTGPSVIFDPWGRPAALIDPLFSTGTAAALISESRGGTTYSQYGDLFAYSCITISFLWLCGTVFSYRITPRKTSPGGNVQQSDNSS
jgi:apolipoprotein N-acyltransferase